MPGVTSRNERTSEPEPGIAEERATVQAPVTWVVDLASHRVVRRPRPMGPQTPRLPLAGSRH